MKQNRLKSKVMWLGICSALFMFYNAIAAEYGLPVIAEGSYSIIINAILGLLVAFGVINNPTNPDSL